MDIFLSNVADVFLLPSGADLPELDSSEDVSEHSVLSISLEHVPSSCGKQIFDTRGTKCQTVTKPIKLSFLKVLAYIVYS
jgi:hypothetical protein